LAAGLRRGSFSAPLAAIAGLLLRGGKERERKEREECKGGKERRGGKEGRE